MASDSFIRPSWVFFDLDDTLWDFRSNSMKSLRFVFDKFPEINSRFDSFESFSEVYHIHNSAMWEAFAKGEVSSDHIKTERWRATLFPDSHSDSCLSICRIINDMYLYKLAEYPETVEDASIVLQSLASDHMIAILSNGFADTQYRKINFSGLWKHITRLVVSDEIGIQKPDPRLYEYAVSATGATGIPVMVGDNPSTDILGALRAGWKAIWFNPDRKPSLLSVDFMRYSGIKPDLYLGEAHSLRDAERLIREGDAVKF